MRSGIIRAREEALRSVWIVGLRIGEFFEAIEEIGGADALGKDEGETGRAGRKRDRDGFPDARIETVRILSEVDV